MAAQPGEQPVLPHIHAVLAEDLREVADEDALFARGDRVREQDLRLLGFQLLGLAVEGAFRGDQGARHQSLRVVVPAGGDVRALATDGGQHLGCARCASRRCAAIIETSGRNGWANRCARLTASGLGMSKKRGGEHSPPLPHPGHVSRGTVSVWGTLAESSAEQSSDNAEKHCRADYARQRRTAVTHSSNQNDRYHRPLTYSQAKACEILL